MNKAEPISAAGEGGDTVLISGCYYNILILWWKYLSYVDCVEHASAGVWFPKSTITLTNHPQSIQ